MSRLKFAKRLKDAFSDDNVKVMSDAESATARMSDKEAKSKTRADKFRQMKKDDSGFDTTMEDEGLKVEGKNLKQRLLSPKKAGATAAGLGAVGLGAAALLSDEDREKYGFSEDPEFEDDPIETKEKPKAPVQKAEPKPVVKETKPEEPKEKDEIDLIRDSITEELDVLKNLDAPPITADQLRKQMRDDLKKARDGRIDMMQWARIAERLVAGITKFAAAKEGLNRGLDMSNAEIEREDWDRRIDQAMDEYKVDMNDLIGKFDREDKALSDVESRRERSRDRIFDLRRDIARIEEARKRAAEAAKDRELDRAQRLQIAKMNAAQRQADRELRQEIAKFKAASKPKKESSLLPDITSDPKVANALISAAINKDDKMWDRAYGSLRSQGLIKPQFTISQATPGWTGKVLDAGDADDVREYIQQKATEMKEELQPESEGSSKKIPLNYTKKIVNFETGETLYKVNGQWVKE